MTLQGFVWVDASAKMPTEQRRRSLRACLPDQAGGAAGTPWWLRRSCHLTQLASQFVSRLASQQCTQMPQNGTERPFLPICVHSCIPMFVHNSATAQQCTQTPQSGAERPFSAICVHYCVLASVHNSATAQQCTQTPQSGAERPDPPICVHYCDPKATHSPSPRPNSVHKCSNPVRRGHFDRSVYTPASVALAVRPTPSGR